MSGCAVGLTGPRRLEEAAQAQQIIEHAQAAIDHGDIATAEAALERRWLEPRHRPWPSSDWGRFTCSKAGWPTRRTASAAPSSSTPIMSMP